MTESILMLVLMLAIFYFMLIRPENKRKKANEEMRSSLKKGSKVITAGGIYGRVVEVQETTLLVEIDSNVKIRIDKNSVVKDPSDNQQA